MTSFRLLYVTFFVMKFLRADIVPGKCPKVSGTKFNCSEIPPGFLEGYNPLYDKHIS